MAAAEQFRFAQEYVDADPVTGTAFHCKAQFCQTFFCIFAASGENRGRQIPEIHGQPQAVDAFMRQFVEIFFRIVIHVIGQFVDEKRRTVGRTEETAGNTVSDKRFASPASGSNGRPFRFTDPVFQKINGAAQTVRIRRLHRCSFRRGTDFVFFVSEGGIFDETDQIAALFFLNALGFQYPAQRHKCGIGKTAGPGKFQTEFHSVLHAVRGCTCRTSSVFPEMIFQRTFNIFDEPERFPRRLRNL